MRLIEYDGKQFTQGEFEDYLSCVLPDKYKETVELAIRGIKGSLESIEHTKKNIESSIALLITLAAIEPVIQPLADKIKAELESLR
jgi:hypothetical protein